MNKKLNTALFMIVATALNLVIMIVILFVPLIAYYQFVSRNLPSQVYSVVNTIVTVAIFIGSIVGTYFLYNLIMKKFMEKVNMDKYFDPIFKPKARKPR